MPESLSIVTSHFPAGAALVVGGGRFGRLAARRLGGWVGTVVEPRPSDELRGLGVPLLEQDGVQALQEALARPWPPRWIVPCLPRHLLADWLRLSLAPLRPRPMPLPSGLPHLAQVLPGPEHIWYLSLTDSLCPDDCPESGRICPKTGQCRGLPLFSRLGRLRLGRLSNGVLRSYQLAPGVGGLASREMLALRQRMASGGQWLVGAACRCHGVVQALELDPPRPGRAI